MRNDPSRSIQPRRRGRPRTVQLHRVVKFHTSVFEPPNVRTIVRKKEAAFRSRLLTLEIMNSRNYLDVRQFCNNVERIITGNIRRELARNNNLKVNVVVIAE